MNEENQAGTVSSYSRREMALLGVALLAAVVFWINIGTGTYRPYLGSFIMKWIPTGILALMVYRHRRTWQEFFLFLALLLQSVGDVILDFDRIGNVKWAIGFIISAHIAYCVFFFLEKEKRAPLSRSRKIAAVVVAIYGIMAGAYFFSNSGGLMRIGVSLYALAITGAAILSLRAGYRSILIFAAVLMYIFTDTIVAYSEFVGVLKGSHFYTWPIYYLGQMLLVLVYLKEKAGRVLNSGMLQAA